MVGNNDYLWKHVFENEFIPIHKETEEFYIENAPDIQDYFGEDEKPVVSLDTSKPFKQICLEVIEKVREKVEVDTTLQYYRSGGSGLGIYERLPSLQIERIDKETFFAVEPLIHSKSIETPLLGINSFALHVGSLEHLIKGPVTDPDGHNCWLNSFLVFLGSNASLISKIFNGNYPRDSLGDSLKLFYNYWISNHDKETFREEFHHYYGRVWLNFQRLGYQYGYDYSAIQVFHSIMNELNIKVEVEEVFIILENNDSMNMEGYEFNSCISHEVLAHTKDNFPIGHFTCYMENEKGMFYYDDILQMNDDFQGGMLKTGTEIQPKNIQLSLFTKKTAKLMFPDAFKEQSRTNFTMLVNLEAEEIKFKGKSTLTMDEVLHALHLIRFSCEFDMLDTFTLDFKRRKVGKTHQSEEKKKNLIKREIDFISTSKNSKYGMYLVANLGLFDFLFTIPSELSLNIDFMDCLRNLETESTIYSFLEPFSNQFVMKKKRRKYRKVALRDIFLSQLFYGKQDIKKMKTK